MKKFLALYCAVSLAITLFAAEFHTWAPTPPMGWNSWDCFGASVVESEVKSNADYMAKNLAKHGWEYVVVDIRWYVSNQTGKGYVGNPQYTLDEYGRYIPPTNRFPSAADGAGFKPLADYVHNLGLKFGIHIMRGVPKSAVSKKLPVLGTDGITCNMIANSDSTCTWLNDNMKADCTKAGAQEYYNSIFDLYAQWGVDFVKVDDLARPYHTGEIEMIRRAIDRCGRPMVLSISPGETPLDRIDHVASHANMWRTVDDFWDNWSQLKYQFGICAKWAPYISQGAWPDADMLPLGKISIRGERGAERYSSFTPDEQRTVMTLWSIFKSPLMFGGDMPQNTADVNALLTNDAVLDMHHYSAGNAQVNNTDNKVTWKAIDTATGARYAALFNINSDDWITGYTPLYSSGTIAYTNGFFTNVAVEIPAGSNPLALMVADGGDTTDYDHADWANPVVVLADGTRVDATELKVLRSFVGWGSLAVNKNLNGGKMSINGTPYDKGFAVHANSLVLLELPQNAVRFEAVAGIDNTGSDQGTDKPSVEFLVYNYDPTIRNEKTDGNAGSKTIVVDPGKQITTSGYMTRGTKYDISADVTGAEKLYLVVTNGADGLDYDHADWANPVLVDADGNETSLTTLAWEPDPVNGWNTPKLNANNDGNTMAICGTTYAKGFGTNAPSMLTFALPNGHKYTAFKATVGLDDDVANASKGATVEFRVFTTDPAPENGTEIPLNLELLGFGTGEKAEITDMWTGENLGTFTGSEFAPFIKVHGSGLYRLTPSNRTSTASVTLKCTENGDNIVLTATIDDGGDGEQYVRLLRDGNVMANLTPDASGVATYTIAKEALGCGAVFNAIYSGTTTVAPAKSADVVYGTPGGVSNAVATATAVRPVDGGVEVTAADAGTFRAYNTAGVLTCCQPIAEGKNFVPLHPGIYLIDGVVIYVK